MKAKATTTAAVARYLLADVVHSQRVILPFVVQVGVLAVLFGGDPGPLPAPWGVSCLAAYPVAGTALGLLCARPLVPRIGWSLLLGVIVVIVTAVQPWLPPVGVAIAVLVDGRGPAALVVPVAVAFVLAIGAAVVGATAAGRA